jgi:hypothetical protein
MKRILIYIFLFLVFIIVGMLLSLFIADTKKSHTTVIPTPTVVPTRIVEVTKSIPSPTALPTVPPTPTDKPNANFLEVQRAQKTQNIIITSDIPMYHPEWGDTKDLNEIFNTDIPIFQEKGVYLFSDKPTEQPKYVYVDKVYIKIVNTPQRFVAIRAAGIKTQKLYDLTYGTAYDNYILTVSLHVPQDLINEGPEDRLSTYYQNLLLYSMWDITNPSSEQNESTQMEEGGKFAKEYADKTLLIIKKS